MNMTPDEIHEDVQGLLAPLRAMTGVGAIQNALAETRAWVERAVVGLNLCPFAKAPHAKGQIRYVLSAASDAQQLLADLQRELETLAEADPAVIETTLLVHPFVLTDFSDFNDFLDPAEALLDRKSTRLNSSHRP